MFTDLFGSGRGRPSVPAEQIATVMVLQSLEGLSDREAVQAVRTDIRWKVAAGLTLDDEGFHPTVLTLWRNKLRQSDRPERIFDAVRNVITATGVLSAKTRFRSRHSFGRPGQRPALEPEGDRATRLQMDRR